MNGIEKITERIDGEAQAELDRLLGGAKKTAAATVERFRAQAEKESAERRDRDKRAAAEREERLVSMAQLEARKTTLAARQELVEKAFSLALEKLCAMPEADYIAAAAKLLCEAAPDGCGAAVFNPKDRARIGQKAVDAANQKLEGKLTLSPETRDIRGGFILQNGSVEVNCTFETLVRLQKGVMSGEVAKLLFPGE